MTHAHSPSTAMLNAAKAYKTDYQPTYDNTIALEAAQHELEHTTPLANPHEVMALRQQLGAIAGGNLDRPIIIEQRCAEPVDLSTPIDYHVQAVMRGQDIVAGVLPNALHIPRAGGQNSKPRSSYWEKLADGTYAVSYMGDAINRQDPSMRTPDPTNMVSAALQARDLADGLREARGTTTYLAHEALLLPYEQGLMGRDAVSGKPVLLSAHLPWIGERTRDPDGAHVSLLAGVENPVGVKIGPTATAEDIARLSARLNPAGEADKLIFMMRMGGAAAVNGALHSVLNGISDHAPSSLVMYDIHGVTKTAPDGTKIRSIEDIVTQVDDLARACGDAGLKLNGLHLESRTDAGSEHRLECVATDEDRPTHPGGVDPQLNPSQLREVLERTASYL
jgi:3-deoxy-7-phosphoheptulonate synthase